MNPTTTRESDPKAELLSNASDATRQTPAWYRSMSADIVASVANTFILHGAGAYDYAVGTELCADWLTTKMARFYQTVVRYNLGSLDAEPLSFSGPPPVPGKEQDYIDPRERFELLTGLRQAPGQPPTAAAAPSPYDALARNGQAPAAGAARPLPSSSVGLVSLLMRFLRAAEDETAAVIIEGADMLVPPADLGTMAEGQRQIVGMLRNSGTDPLLTQRGNPLVLLAPTLESIHADLPTAKTGIQSIEVPLPDQAERLQFLQMVYDTKTNQQQAPMRLEVSLEQVASLTAGLYRRHALDVWLRGERTGALTKQLVVTRKNEIMLGEYREVLETQEPRFSFDDVGGNPLLKEWLREHIVQRMRTGKVKRFPKGVIFTGPSGTGKSLLAEALAYELGINVVLLRPEKIKGSLYGQSEQNLARAMAGIRANVPCVVFIDEIDQRFRRGGGGAGGAADAAEDNIFGRMLEEVGDPYTRGQVLWLGATNRPKLCDAALFRPGRFDEKLPILPPDSAERQGIFETLVRRHADGDVPDLSGTDWSTIVSTSNGWTGAEIEQAVISAYDLNELRSLSMPAALLQASQELLPSTRDIALHTDEAIAACNRRELLPPAYRARATDEAQLERSAEELARRSGIRSTRERELD